MSFQDALEQAKARAKPAVDWLTPLLDCTESDAQSLYMAADVARAVSIGDGVYQRGLVEFSNICKKNCTYCGIQSGNTKVERYRMTPEEILECAHLAKELNYGTVVLQSGEDPWYTPEILADIIRKIKAETDRAITLSTGEHPEAVYKLWKDAGADRYLLRIETTDPKIFAAIHPDDDLEERKQCLYTLKKLDYQLGSGVLTGLPGQTPEMLAKDVIWLHELGAEMIGVGPFIPHPDTPLKDAKGGTIDQTLRLIAVLRLVFPYAHLPATTAMGSLDPKGREKALMAGANIVMPNVTPTSFRPQYELYPGKICTGDDARHCSGCIAGRIESTGRKVVYGPGHVIRNKDVTGD